MKSNKQLSGSRTNIVLLNFTSEQLKWLGAVAMAYNDAETTLHKMFGACMFLPTDTYEISSRIIGTEGLAAVIRATAAKLTPNPDILNLVVQALADFAQLKSYRDLVIHARVMDTKTAYAERPERQGKRIYTTLTAGALKALSTHLSALNEEMLTLVNLIDRAKSLFFGRAADDQHKAQLEAAIQDGLVRAQSHRNHRQYLPPLPKLPQEGKPDGHKSRCNNQAPRRKRKTPP